MTEAEQKIQRELDHVFRSHWGQMVAALTRILGTARIELAENLVQDAFVAALKTWAFQGIPEQPVGWLIVTAKNRALDHLKHERVHTRDQDKIRQQLEFWAESSSPKAEATFDREVKDDLLRMMFVCCFPELNAQGQIALILKNLCGFSVKEIARGFLQKEKAIEQRLMRARKTIRDKDIAFALPGSEVLPERLGVVLDSLYLLFNEGYAATEGDELIRRDLCADAIRLLDLVIEHPVTNSPACHALQAIFCLQASRFDARFDESGHLVLLEEQDRSRWDQNLIGKGLFHLGQATAAEQLSSFHIEAGIAAEYATAPSFAAMNWRAVVDYYDILLKMKQNPVVELNRAVALAMSGLGKTGAEDQEKVDQAMEKLYALTADEALSGYHLLYAAIAEIERRRGQVEIARQFLERALGHARTVPETEFLQRRLTLLFTPE